MKGATDVNDRLVLRGGAKRTNVSRVLTTALSSKVAIIPTLSMRKPRLGNVKYLGQDNGLLLNPAPAI